MMLNWHILYEPNFFKTFFLLKHLVLALCDTIKTTITSCELHNVVLFLIWLSKQKQSDQGGRRLRYNTHWIIAGFYLKYVTFNIFKHVLNLTGKSLSSKLKCCAFLFLPIVRWSNKKIGFRKPHQENGTTKPNRVL